jgi:hypothetical protein
MHMDWWWCGGVVKRRIKGEGSVMAGMAILKISNFRNFWSNPIEMIQVNLMHKLMSQWPSCLGEISDWKLE